MNGGGTVVAFAVAFSSINLNYLSINWNIFSYKFVTMKLITILSRTLIATIATVQLFSCVASRGNGASNYVTSRAPLSSPSFIELPLGSIGADGWLHEMLVRQANGATGHLDELYPKVVGERNGWLGGDGDQWERGPYWIDGLLPLAYILKDSSLIAKTTPWIEWALSSAREDGQFGPSTDYSYEPGIQRDNCEDWWPRMVVLKVLQQYYSATGDTRVTDLMTNYFRYQLDNLDERPLDNWTFWARYRGGDNLMVVYWLYNITGDKFLLELGDKIYSQTEPFAEDFLKRDRLSRIGTIHCVNLAQGMKTPIIYYQYSKDPELLTSVEYALDDISRFHGMPTGVFAGDELIHGNNPTQGTELCTIVEYMFTLESMYRITGNLRFADLLEKIAYNALPAQTDDEYLSRQYFQQANQVNSMRIANNFDCDHGVDNAFGLLTGYPCCTCNMHQGWPKFTQNTWYATPEGGLAAIQYAPTHVEALVADGVRVNFREETQYPFETTVRIRLESIERSCVFPLCMRVPSWSVRTSVSVNGELLEINPDSDGLVRISREWNEGDKLEISFTPEVRLTNWYENSTAVQRGPLVYAYPIPAEKRFIHNTVDGSDQGDYFEIRAIGPWNYALTETSDWNLQNHYRFDDSGLSCMASFPWNVENSPVSITTDAVRALNWKEYNGMAGPVPYGRAWGFKCSSEKESIRLIPYGCTTLRITEFPMTGSYSADNYKR